MGARYPFLITRKASCIFMCFFFRWRFKQGGESGGVGGELFYSRLDKLGLKLDVGVSLAEFIMTKINKFSFEGPRNSSTFVEYIFILCYVGIVK